MKHVLDGRRITTKAAMLDALADVLGFPDYFGRNYDALNDLVNDAQLGRHTLVWQYPQVLQEADPDAYEQFVDILGNAEGLKLQLEP
ncbi:MAG: barstar family protein [Kibdelosporangium sp.]